MMTGVPQGYKSQAEVKMFGVSRFVLHIYIPIPGARLQSDAAVSDGESGQSSGYTQKQHSGRQGLVNNTEM